MRLSIIIFQLPIRINMRLMKKTQLASANRQLQITTPRVSRRL
jgi:hypothetical protein